MLRWVVVCRGWWRWVDSLVGWSGWLCVLCSCCARETRGFRACTSGTARQNSHQFHVARTTFGSTTFPCSFPASVADNPSSRRRYLFAAPILFLSSAFQTFLFATLNRRSHDGSASSRRINRQTLSRGVRRDRATEDANLPFLTELTPRR